MPLFPILYWKGGFFLPADARIKSVAVLLDGGFVRKRLRALLGHQPSAAEIRELAFCLLGPDEELFRIYYYDCYPPQEWAHNPLSGERVHLKIHEDAQTLLPELSELENVAFRQGTLLYKGWRIRDKAAKRLISDHGSGGHETLHPEDLVLNFDQKGVDMRIGLDVAWLASRRIVDRLVLVTADSDFIPAMKFARREGVQVVLAPLRTRWINRQLFEHADFVRDDLTAYVEASAHPDEEP